MDWKIVQDLGLTVFVTVSVMSACFWLVKTIIGIGNQHLTTSSNNIMLLLKSHEEERAKWIGTIDKYTDKIERSMEFIEKEHSNIILAQTKTLEILTAMQVRMERIECVKHS